LVFSDESGFFLMPNAKTTWAPKGHTPSVRLRLGYGRLNVLGGLVVSAGQRKIRLHALTTTGNVSSEEILLFMQHVLRHEPGLIFWIWDGAPIHDNDPVGRFVSAHPRLRLIQLPAYAPELNPCELIWAQTEEQLSSRLIFNMNQLSQHVTQSLLRSCNSQDLLWSCIYASNLPWPR
jgi:putative transposase